jgi:polysaccharide export outer membrane protein
MTKYITLLLSIIFIGLICSCDTTRKINPDTYIYFRDGSDTVTAPFKSTIIQPGDVINIRVFSSTANQEQAAIFNIPNSDKSAAPGGYQVNEVGNIEMPIIGSIKAAGLTLNQMQDVLSKKLANYVKNPSIIVNFLDFNINVLGEVRKPGLQKFTVDRVTVIDALGAAGDLTDFGERQDIIVIREENGKKIYNSIDLTKRDFLLSPVYLLQPNDVVYVKPNANKLKDLSANPDAQRKTGIILSVVGILVSVASVIVFAVSYKN